MRFFGRSVRFFGILAISLFCAAGVLLSFLKRDLGRTDYGAIVVGLSLFEDRFQDFKVRQRLTNTLDKDIVLINIDDESLSKIGTWPLPRTIHAKMIRQLKDFGTKVVALDILFPEKAPVCGEADPDKELAKAFNYFLDGGQSAAILSYELDDDNGVKAPVPEDLLYFVKNSQSQGGAAMELAVVSRENYPIKDLIVPNLQLGHIYNNEDEDGVFRNYKIVANIRDGEDSAYFPSLGLMAFESFINNQTTLTVQRDGWGVLELNELRLEVTPYGESKIRYFGDRRNFDSIPLHTLINSNPSNKELKKRLEGKIAFVGSSATGAHDLRNTPVDPKLPGVYAHMNATHMLLNNYFFRPEEESIRWSFILLFGSIALLLIINWFDSAVLDLVGVISIQGFLYYIDYIYFFPKGYEIRLFYCFLCLGLIYSWETFLNFSQAAKERKQIKGTFSRYVSPAVVSEMLDHPDKLKVGGERKDITCLFSDVRDFTSISEKLSATELSGALNQYMGQMTDIVFETKGTLDKYIGDAIVALWGAPLDLPDHPAHAVEAAVKMWEALPAINQDFKKRGLPEFNVGIGINSGECSVGNMGSNSIFSYTALGDNMNLGARLEGLCKFYGTNILISEYTLERLPEGKFTTRPIDSVIVKGKTKPVAIYEVLHPAHVLNKKTGDLSSYCLAYKDLLDKNFSGAILRLKEILLNCPDDKPSKRLTDLCEKWLKENNIPDDFYITKMTEK